MITVDLRIKNTELTITSVEDLIKFQESESASGIEGSITYDGTKHFAYSLAEVMLVISSLNIGDLSDLVSVEVDLENSSKEIQEIILDAIVEIEELNDKSEVNIQDKMSHGYTINNATYGITIHRKMLMILNVDMHDRFLFNDELEYENKCARHLFLTDSQISGIKSYFEKYALSTQKEETLEDVDLVNSHEDIKHIAIGLVRKIDNLDAKAEINIMPNNPTTLISGNNSYSVYISANELLALKKGIRFDDYINKVGHKKVTLINDQLFKCVPYDLDLYYDCVDPYIVQLEEEIS